MKISKFQPSKEAGSLTLDFTMPTREQFSQRSLQISSGENSLRGTERPRKAKKKGGHSSAKSKKRKDKYTVPTAMVTITSHNTNPSRSKSSKSSKKDLNGGKSSAALPYRVTRTSQPSQAQSRRAFTVITEDKGEVDDDSSWF